MANVDVLFILIGAILVLFMHAGFAFLEVGTVRYKNQANALSKIIVDISVATISYFFIGYGVAYGSFIGLNLDGDLTQAIIEKSGYELVKFFFLMTFAAAIPAIISGGIAERAKFYPQMIASIFIVALLYPLIEGIFWNGNFGIQSTLESTFGAPFHDFAGSLVVHGVGGWIALAAIMQLGPRIGRKGVKKKAFPPSSIPFLALGSWILIVGWFGFNVMSAQKIEDVQGLVAINSLMAMAGGTLGSLIVGKRDPGFLHNGPLAGLVAICAGSDVVSPIAAIIIGILAGIFFVKGFVYTQNKLNIDDVLGVWPLHGLCGLWGVLACGIFGYEIFGGLGGVAFTSQLTGAFIGVVLSFLGGHVVYGLLRVTIGIRITQQEEHEGNDLAVHNVTADHRE